MTNFDSKKYVPALPGAPTAAEREYLRTHPDAKYVPAFAPDVSAKEIAWRAKNGNRYVSAPAPGPHTPSVGPGPGVIGGLIPLTAINTAPNNKQGVHAPYSPEPIWHRTVFESSTMGNIVVYYYVPPPLNSTNTTGTSSNSGAPQLAPGAQQAAPSRPRRLVVAIHGAGTEHYTGAQYNINIMGLADITDDSLSHYGTSFADLNNTIIIAPCFDQWYGQLLLEKDPAGNYEYPAGYVPPWWAEPGSQEDCAFLYAFFKAAQWPALKGPDPNDPYPDSIFQAKVADFTYNLSDFYYTVDWLDPYRPDVVLNNIVAQFQQAFAQAGDPVEDTFMLYGHSGGAQFVSHYLLMWPENLSSVALSSPGNLLFPRVDYRFPFGLDVDIRDGVLYADYGVIWAPGQNPVPGSPGDQFPTTDFTLLQDLHDTPALWFDEIRDACVIPKIVSVGLKEAFDPTLYNDPTTSYGAWQGRTPVDKTYNYYLEMNRAFAIVRATHGADWPADAYHDNMALLMFDVDHGDNLTHTWNWLKLYWLDYPARIPYVYYTQNPNNPNLVTATWGYAPAGPDSPWLNQFVPVFNDVYWNMVNQQHQMAVTPLLRKPPNMAVIAAMREWLSSMILNIPTPVPTQEEIANLVRQLQNLANGS
jgi:pimeloyl-ACP methyl ester carboxylesterase